MHSRKTAKVIHSSSFDPYENLALEEYLFSLLSRENQGKQGDGSVASLLTRDDVILYLWQNDNTVVIGKNQNAWKECDWTRLEAEGGKLARRLSGGGAVYHDLGNLNYTFITSKDEHAEEQLTAIILEAVQSCGIEASFSGRNDLCAEGRKFSGMASYQQGSLLLQHGTLLVNTNFNLMERYLSVSPAKIRSKGIDSVRARVVNLASLEPELDVATLGRALETRFQSHYGDFTRLQVDELPADPLLALYSKYASWEWRFGTSPDFDLEINQTFGWGNIDLCLKLKDGLIEKAFLYSDAMDSQLITAIARTMTGLRFEPHLLASELLPLAQNTQQAQIIRDLLTQL